MSAVLPPPPSSNKVRFSRQQLAKQNSMTNLNQAGNAPTIRRAKSSGTILSSKVDYDSDSDPETKVTEEEKARKSKRRHRKKRGHKADAKPVFYKSKSMPVDLSDPFAEIGMRDLEAEDDGIDNEDSSTSESDVESEGKTLSKNEEKQKKRDEHAQVTHKRNLQIHRRNNTALPNTSTLDVTVDALPYMKRGTAFLKYGRRGYPHFRHFHLSSNNRTLQWYSKSKKLAVTQIPLDIITNIVIGQTTGVFQKFPAPELQKSSFSILYTTSDGIKTLDLIAKDTNDFQVWTVGLQALITAIRSDDRRDPSQMSQLPIDLKLRRGKRSAKILLTLAGIPLDAELDKVQPKKSNDTSFDRRSLELSLTALQLQYEKLDKQIRYKLFRRLSYPRLITILDEIKESLDLVEQWLGDGELSAVDDELWRAGIEIETLEHVYKATK